MLIGASLTDPAVEHLDNSEKVKTKLKSQSILPVIDNYC